MKLTTALTSFALATLCVAGTAFADGGKPVGITKDLMSVPVIHNGAKSEITRDQNNAATVIPAFAKTSRPCPPFCIQPASLHPQVETIGELEVIDYISKMQGGDKSILVIDSRTPDWVAKGTIPGAKNIPWTKLSLKKGASQLDIDDILTGEFNAKEGASGMDFSNSKTLVMFCNGMWCGQSPTNIKALLNLGYPPEKIKWYRGGMQDWAILGLSTAK